jgi:hypothetical protein
MLEMCRPARDIGIWGLGIDGILQGRVGLDLVMNGSGLGLEGVVGTLRTGLYL